MTMAFRPFEDFTPIAPTSAATMQKYSGILEEAVLEMWQIHGFGLAANGFLKVIDPDYYREMVGGYLPHRDMVPLFATGLGDIVVASGGGYRVLQYRYSRISGMSSSIRHLGLKITSAEWREEIYDSAPYDEAAAAYGPLTAPADFDNIYASTLPLPAGGSESVEFLTRSRIFEHIALTTQLAGPIPFTG
ncbi:GAD-like domain-containing protein [Microbacterium sp. BH-3-3-3]|uniref:GAD-like domain-containing protein n=1 Tax=Microbacterium sp. BH-3-3-3 TaxID=1906742 RepID=UPI00119EFBEF|nr:GAD-like domain-containing protein [Microbacterium sp. BH-3-3-3]